MQAGVRNVHSLKSTYLIFLNLVVSVSTAALNDIYVAGDFMMLVKLFFIHRLYEKKLFVWVLNSRSKSILTKLSQVPEMENNFEFLEMENKRYLEKRYPMRKQKLFN